MICKRCGLEKPGSKESIEPLGHQWEIINEEEPTCTEPGVISKVCKRCGEEEDELIDPLGTSGIDKS